MKDRTHDKTQKVSKKETESIFPFIEMRRTSQTPSSKVATKTIMKTIPIYVYRSFREHRVHFSLRAFSSSLLSKSAIQEPG
eukprot:scaffold3131_cov106-Skeletonema_dohrnii-CCMP3373.AAC.6